MVEGTVRRGRVFPGPEKDALLTEAIRTITPLAGHMAITTTSGVIIITSVTPRWRLQARNSDPKTNIYFMDDDALWLKWPSHKRELQPVFIGGAIKLTTSLIFYKFGRTSGLSSLADNDPDAAYAKALLGGLARDMQRNPDRYSVSYDIV